MESGQIEPPDTYETYEAVEALLIVAAEPLTLDELVKLSESDIYLVKEALLRLSEHYDSSKRAFFLAEVAGGYQLRTRPELAYFVREYVTLNYATKLSNASLETLAIVAYRQPASRAQISAIRGVNSDGVVRLLVARGYIAPTLRDSGPGQALLYTTTSRFLERMGLSSLSDLPDLSEFVPSAEVVEVLEAALFNE